MADEYQQARSSLGERLLIGVRNLWKEVHQQGKVLDHHGQEIEGLRKRLATLEHEARGLRISRGLAKAKNAKLQAVLTESDETIAAIRAMLH